MRDLSPLLLLTASLATGQASAGIDFARDVRPIFEEHCYACHGPSQQLSGMRLDRRSSAFAIRGGTVIGPGNSAGSGLYLRISGTKGTQMPPTGPLTPEQIHVIRDWIDQGAIWPDALAGEKAAPADDPRARQIMDALRQGHSSALERLLRAKPDLNRPGINGDTPLLYAVLYGNPATIRSLLDAGADPNLSNHLGVTPLMWAVDDVAKVRVLVGRGANPDAVSESGNSALMLALERADGVDSALFLISRSKVTGLSARSRRSAAGNEKLLRALLDKGVPAKSLAGGLRIAFANDCQPCAKMLIPSATKTDFSAALRSAAFESAPPAKLQPLLESGADPNESDGFASVMQLYAANESAPAASLRLLLERGGRADLKMPQGLTLLDLALRQGDTPVAEVLRKAGAAEAQGAPPPAKPDPAPTAGAALARAVPLLQRSGGVFLRKSGCVSCHNNNLLSMTIAALRAHNIPYDSVAAAAQFKTITDYIEAARQNYLQEIPIPGGQDTTSYLALGLAFDSYPSTAGTDALARYLSGVQRLDGSWRLGTPRPPIESSAIEVTAVSARVLQVYAPPSQRARYEESVRRAAAWLANANPVTTEDRAFQLLGVTWAGAQGGVVRKFADSLLEEQRADGGWSQLRALTSDAYATGQALVALEMAGVLTADSPQYRKGVGFLLRTQMPDGSWFVRSRAIPLQPYFDSEFPYGTDQFISAAATSWAATALAKVQ